MGRIEFQISTELLQQAVQDVLEPRLYKQCSVSPVPGLILDRVGIATVGPIVPSPTNVVITVQATIYVVTPDDVIKANGQPPHSSLAPNGVVVSGTVILSMDGTTLKAVWGGITHDAHYQLLQSIVASLTGEQRAIQLFSQWEHQIHDALGSSPIIDEDLAKQLPPPFNHTQIGRTAVTGDDNAIMIRLEIGARGTDGLWLDVILGVFTAFVSRGKWAMFISGDVLEQLVDSSLYSAIFRSGVFATVSSTFGPGPSEGPGSEAQVNSTVSIPFTVTYKFLGVTVETDQGQVDVNATTDFQVVHHGSKAELEITLSYDVNVNLGGFLSDFVQIFVNLGSALESHIDFSIPNFTSEGGNTFVSRIDLDPIVFASFLTLSFTSASYHVVNEAVLPENPLLFNNPQFGMLIQGDANVTKTPDVPDCSVTETGFVVVFVPSQQTGPATAADTAAFASAEIINAKVAGGGSRYPLVIGQFLPVNDPDLLWISMLPSTPTPGGKYTFKLPETRVPASYFEHPYPVAAIVCTNGGARYIKLGVVPQPSEAIITRLIDGLKTYLNIGTVPGIRG